MDGCVLANSNLPQPLLLVSVFLCRWMDGGPMMMKQYHHHHHHHHHHHKKEACPHGKITKFCLKNNIMMHFWIILPMQYRWWLSFAYYLLYIILLIIVLACLNTSNNSSSNWWWDEVWCMAAMVTEPLWREPTTFFMHMIGAEWLPSVICFMPCVP